TDPFAFPPGFHRFAERAQGINWQSCGDNGSRECGRFEVPLDYQNATAGKASLAVARLRVTRQPKVGTLFVNPGGPGESGVDLILGGAEDILETAGGRYDIRAYDFRKSVGPDAELNSADVRNVLYNGLYAPTSWSDLAKELKDMSNFLDDPRSSRPPKKRSFMRPRTRIRRNAPITPFKLSLAQTQQTPEMSRSRWCLIRLLIPPELPAQYLGNSGVRFVTMVRIQWTYFSYSGMQAGLYCHNWPVRAVERFTGPFNKTLSNKVIVVGNEADPSTPFLSAKRVADALGDSAILIEQDDFGTNQVLFPGPGITKNTLSVLAASEASDSAELRAEPDQARAYGWNMTVAVIVLACTAALLLVALVVSAIHGRKVRAPAQVTYVAPEALAKAVPGKA
ncbi:hypothetical protein FRC06_008648, partial [Ceratobasidium sp. 370]